jgi:hypothetical protein
MFMRAIAGTREGGRLRARATASGPHAVLAIEHERGAPDPLLAWVGEVVAAAAAEMGGRLEESTAADVGRVALVLPRERPL